VPDLLVMELLKYLEAQGYGEVEEITTANERITFSLPRELRKDLVR
jgi:4-hydroxy-3-methylbut-2-enyl diphosphate reductase